MDFAFDRASDPQLTSNSGVSNTQTWRPSVGKDKLYYSDLETTLNEIEDDLPIISMSMPTSTAHDVISIFLEKMVQDHPDVTVRQLNDWWLARPASR